MRAKILILSVLTIAVLVSSGCVQQPSGPICNPPYIIKGNDCCLDQNSNQICDTDEQQPPSVQDHCPSSCDDGDECTKDYCSAVTGYECRNDLIIPCCGNDICEPRENYIECPEDCNEPIELGQPVASERVFNQGGTYWTIFRREVYDLASGNVSSSVITIPISINERIEEVKIQTECNVNESTAPNSGSFECDKPSDCDLGKTNISLDYKDIVRDLEKGDSVNAEFVLWAKFDDNMYYFKCEVNVTGSNPEQTELLYFDFTYSNYGA